MEDSRTATGALLLGARIRTLRDGREMRLVDLADASGLSLTYLSNIEHGQRMPSLEALLAIAEGLGTSVTGLLEGLYPFDVARQPRRHVAPVVDGRRAR